MSALFILSGCFLAFVIYFELVYPFVVYPIQAHRHKCGSVTVVGSRLFGIPMTIRILSKIRRDILLKYLTTQDLKLNIKTALRQGLFKWTLVTRDPENIKAILSTKFKDFSLVERNVHMKPVFGSGIFTQDGAEWKHSRDMLKPQFSKEQISRIEHVGKYVDDLIDVIKRHGNCVELQHFFHLMTMDTATDFLFGESVGSLRFGENTKGTAVTDPETGEDVYSSDFVTSYKWLNNFALQRIVFNDLEWLVLLLRPQYRKHLRNTRIFMDHYVRKALEETACYSKEDDANKEGYTFSYELAKETRDPIVIRDQCFNILIAGRDTTASTLSYAFHYFTTHPDVWHKVREDVWSVFPDGDVSMATYEDLRKTKYLQMVIKEVLRLAPAVPLNLRTSIRDTYLPRGGGPNKTDPVFVPRGTTISYSTYVMQRDPEIYGPDADKFIPERWSSENRIANSPMYSWGYIPFNGGPRICLGQQFALTEISLTIVKLALAFKTVEPDVGFDHELRDRTTLTTMVGGEGVPVRFTE